MTHLAVFDWNGTLFDDTPANLIATNYCLRAYGRPEIDLHTLQETFSFPLIHFYERMGIHPDEYLEKAKNEGDHWIKTYAEESANCPVMDGAFDLLSWLNAHGVHCMILSNHLQPLLDEDVTRLGVRPYMRHVSGNDKPGTLVQGLSKQFRLEAYMNDNGFKPEKTFIIGDSHEEPDIARRLGLLGISISGGMLSAARLEKYKADYIIHHLNQVRPILENHWKL